MLNLKTKCDDCEELRGQPQQTLEALKLLLQLNFKAHRKDA